MDTVSKSQKEILYCLYTLERIEMINPETQSYMTLYEKFCVFKADGFNYLEEDIKFLIKNGYITNEYILLEKGILYAENYAED